MLPIDTAARPSTAPASDLESRNSAPPKTTKDATAPAVDKEDDATKIQAQIRGHINRKESLSDIAKSRSESKSAEEKNAETSAPAEAPVAVTEKPAAESAAEKPAAEKPAAEKPAEAAPAAEPAAAEKPAEEKPAE